MAAQGGNLAISLGCMELSIIFNAFFLGIVVIQFINYWSDQKDKRSIHCLVWYTFIMDVAHSMIVTELLWKYTVTGFGDVAALATTQWEYAATPAAMVFTIIPIQLYLGWRVKLLARNPRIGLCFFVLICAMGVTHGTLALYMTCSAFSNDITSLSGFAAYLRVATSWSALSFATDMVLMFALIYMLYSRRTGFVDSDRMIMRIIQVTMQCGIPIAIFSIGHLVSLLLAETTGILYIFSVPVGRLYSNTLLTNLNSRKRILGGASSAGSVQAHVIDSKVLNRFARRDRDAEALKMDVANSCSQSTQSLQMDEMNPGMHNNAPLTSKFEI